MSEARTIGFIGAGAMGGPICRNLIRKSGARVRVFDLRPEAVADCIALGGEAASTVADAVADADLIFTSLPKPEHVETVALGADGVLAHAKAGAIFIDLSTNALKTVKQVASALEASGVTMLDAPVSGGTILAEKGEITMMVGGDAAAFERCRPLLALVAANIFHLGPVGGGTIAKLTNNLIALCSLVASAEGLVLGAAAGLDLDALHKVISVSSGNSLPFRTVSSAARRRNFQPHFALELAQKDLLLALDLAGDIGTPHWMAATVQSVLRRAGELGLGKEDMSAVLKAYEHAFGRVTGQRA